MMKKQQNLILERKNFNFKTNNNEIESKPQSKPKSALQKFFQSKTFNQPRPEVYSLSEFWHPLDLVGLIEFLYDENLQQKFLQRIYTKLTASQFAILIQDFRNELTHSNFVCFESKWENNITNSAPDFTTQVLKIYKEL